VMVRTARLFQRRSGAIGPFQHITLGAVYGKKGGNRG